MDNTGLIEQFLAFVAQTPGLNDYIDHHPELTDIREAIASFRDDLIKEGQLTSQTELMLKILQERLSLIEENSPRGIFAVNPHLAVDDRKILQQFYQDTRDKKRGLREEDAYNQHYKTVREKILRREVDFSGIYEKYLDCNHPYISATLASAFLNAKQYDIGLVFLQKALTHVFSAPNIYWHNHLAIRGCTEALYEFQYLLGPKGMDQLETIFPGGRFYILRCLYLLLSRAIYMTDKQDDADTEHVSSSIITKINSLSQRADLVYDYWQDFSIIFDLGINPDIQFMSDKAYAYQTAEDHGLGLMAREAFQDSLKMYQYGSLVPNNTGGYAESEDDTWGELIERGRIRGEAFADTLYQEYAAGKFCISHPTWPMQSLIYTNGLPLIRQLPTLNFQNGAMLHIGRPGNSIRRESRRIRHTRI